MEISEFAINAAYYHCVTALDRSVEGRQCVIAILPMLSRISRQLARLEWGVTNRAGGDFNAKPGRPSFSIAGTLTPRKC